MIGIYGVKMQYAIYKFDFGPVENGYYLTMVGTARVVALLIVIPLVIRLFKPKLAVPASPPANEEEAADDGSTSEEDEENERRAKHIRLLHDSRPSQHPNHSSARSRSTTQIST